MYVRVYILWCLLKFLSFFDFLFSPVFRGPGSTNVDTVKPVYSGHSRDHAIVVSVDRWSLYEGALVELEWTVSLPTVVSVDRWSLYEGALVELEWTVSLPTVVSVDRWSFYASGL